MNIKVKTTVGLRLDATGPRLKQFKFASGQLRHNRKYCVASNLRQTLNMRVKENKERQHTEEDNTFTLMGHGGCGCMGYNVVRDAD